MRAGAERFLRWSRPAVDVHSVGDFDLSRGRNPLRIRLYRPDHVERAPTLYIHGGAWSAGSIALSDRFCRRLCAGSGRLVASVDYGLAPEDPYPAGLDDCVAALTWLDTERDRIGSDGSDPIVVGESAGANIAAALCLRARAGTARPIGGQVLICPVLGDNFATESHLRWGGGEFLVSSSALADAFQRYLAGHASDSLVAPLREADLRKLPSATIVVAECDPLHDDGVAFAQKLSVDSVPVGLMRMPGLLHGFIYMDGVSEAAARGVDEICGLNSPGDLSDRRTSNG